MAGTGSGRINPAGSCLPDIRPDSRIRKFEKAGYPGSGDPAKTPIRWTLIIVLEKKLLLRIFLKFHFFEENKN